MGEPNVNQLRALAEIVDRITNSQSSTDNDGKILNSAKEIELFDSEAKRYNFTDEDIGMFKTNVAKSDESVAQLMGLQITTESSVVGTINTQSTVTNPQTATQKANVGVKTNTKAITLTKEQREKIEDEVADAVAKLALSGRQDEQSVMNELRRQFGQYLELGDITEKDANGKVKVDAKGNPVFKEGFTKDDIGTPIYEQVDGKNVIAIKPEYVQVLKDVGFISETVDKTGANHQYHLFGFKTVLKYPVAFGSRQYSEGHYKAKEELLAKFPESQKTFVKKVLRSMEQAAKTSRVDAIVSKYKEGFQNQIAAAKEAAQDKATFVPNYEKMLDDFKKAHKEDMKDPEFKAAFGKLKDYLKQHARTRVSELINPHSGAVYKKVVSNCKPGEKVKKTDLRTELRNLSKDGIYRDAIQDMKDDRRILANRGTVEAKKQNGELVGMTYEEATKELKRRFSVMGLFTVKTPWGGEKLTNKLDSYRVDGKNTPLDRSDDDYNFNQLVNDIVSRVGADYLLSRNDGDLQMAEIENVRQFLQGRCPNQKFSDGEIKRLCHLCAIAVEHKDRSIGTFLKNLVAGLPLGLATYANGIITGIEAATRAKGNKGVDVLLALQENSVSSENFTNAFISDLEGQLTGNFQEEFKNMTRQQQLDWISKYIIDLDKLKNLKPGNYTGADILSGQFSKDVQAALLVHKYDNTNENIRKGFETAATSLNNIVISVAVASLPALLSLAFGEEIQEKSCISVSDYAITESTYTDIDKYKEYVGRRFAHNKEKVQAMQSLADACARIADTTGHSWHEIYNDIIRELAGYGSKLNWKECRMLKYAEVDVSKYQVKKPDKPTEPQKPTEPVKPTEPQKPAEPTKPTEPPCPTCEATVSSDVPHKVLPGDGWELIIKTYYSCIPKKDVYKAIAALKKANGIKPSDTNLKGTIILPAELLNCKRDENPDLTDYNKERASNWAKWKKLNGATWHGSNGQEAHRLRLCDGSTMTFRTVKEMNDWIAAHPNVKIQ